MKQSKILTFSKNEDNIKPILAYFNFTTKYILKKKSTIIIPIFSFVSILLLGLFPYFFMTTDINDSQNAAFFELFISIVSSISITLSVVFSTTKALNLFKDISNDGMEILIVSKPIKRGQIIFVRFTYFFLLGIFICLLNYFAHLITLSLSLNKFPPNFSLFNYVTLYFFSMMLGYTFFGLISIMFSLKFSTKLVSGFSSSVLATGIILSQIVPVLTTNFEKDFEYQLRKMNEDLQYDDQYYLEYYLTNQGDLIISRTEDINDLLTAEEKDNIEKAFNSRQDLSWITNLNNFVNPVAAITKIMSPKSVFYNSDNYSKPINFSSFNVSLVKDKMIENNSYLDKNYFLNLNRNIFESSYNWRLGMSLNVQTSDNLELTKQDVVFNVTYSYGGDDSWREMFIKNIDINEMTNTFDELLEQDLNDDISTRDLILSESKPILKNFLTEAIKRIENYILQGNECISLRNSNDGTVKVTGIDHNDFENQMIIYFFYLHGLDKLNNNIDNFVNREIFINSANTSPADPVLPNIFFDYEFSIINNSNKEELLFFEPLNNNFTVFQNNGEKVNSSIIGATWSWIVLLVLLATIVIYSKKDFS